MESRHVDVAAPRCRCSRAAARYRGAACWTLRMASISRPVAVLAARGLGVTTRSDRVIERVAEVGGVGLISGGLPTRKKPACCRRSRPAGTVGPAPGRRSDQISRPHGPDD